MIRVEKDTFCLEKLVDTFLQGVSVDASCELHFEMVRK